MPETGVNVTSDTRLTVYLKLHRRWEIWSRRKPEHSKRKAISWIRSRSPFFHSVDKSYLKPVWDLKLFFIWRSGSEHRFLPRHASHRFSILSPRMTYCCWLGLISDSMSCSGDGFQRGSCQVSKSQTKFRVSNPPLDAFFRRRFSAALNTRGPTLLYVSGSAVMWNNLQISVVSFYSRLPVAAFTPSPSWSPDTCVGKSFRLQSHSVVQYTEIISIDGWNMNWLVNLLLRAKLLFGAVNRCIFYIEYCI